jgi:Secretion system C-terminal sorting domain
MPLVSKSIVLLHVFFLGFTCWLQAQNWLHHPGGTPIPIYRLYADTVTDKVIAVGAFEMAGNVPAQGIAVWDDTAWVPSGIPAFATSPNYYSVGKYNNDYVFGGSIVDWSQADPGYVVRWNGTTFDSIGHLRLGGVYSFQQLGDDLIISTNWGRDTINGVPFYSIARWDGVNWYDMGLGHFNGGIYGTLIHRNQLYAYGRSSTDSLSYLHKFTGNGWQPVGQHLNAIIETFCVFNDEIYLGRFTNGNDMLGCVLKLDTLTNTWVSPGGGVHGNNVLSNVTGMTVMGGKLYVSGGFELAGGVPVEDICTWDGTQWCSLGNSLTYAPRHCAALDSAVFFVPNLMFDSVASTTGFVEWVGGSYTDTCGFLTTSLPEVTQEQTLLPVPNPAADRVQFTLPEHTGYRVLITNSLGQTVLSSAGRESTFFVEVGNYSSGIYFYHLETDEGKIYRGSFCVSSF